MNPRLTRALFGFTRPYPWVIPAMVALGVLASLAEGLGIGLLIPVLDEVVSAGGADPSQGPLTLLVRDLTSWIPADYRLVTLASVIIGLVALKAAILVANTGVSAWISGRVAHDQRVAMSTALLESDYAFVSLRERGQLVNLMETQTYRIGEAMTMLAGFVSASCTVLVFAILLGLLSWHLALIVLIVVLPVSFFVRLMTRRSRRLGDMLVQAHSRLSTRVLELIGSLRTIRLFNGEGAEAARLRASSDEVRGATFRTELLTGAIQPTVEFLYVPVFLAVLGYSLHAGIGVSSLFAFLALLYRLQTPLKRLDHMRVALPSYATAIEELDRLQQESRAHPAHTGTRQFPGLQKEIVFEHVGFSYEGNCAPAVDDVSFTIRRGEVVAILGASGSGKSTLVNLLCRLYEPDSGRILLDGVPLAELDVGSWRGRIAFAGQDADLLDGTIRDNIALGAPGASDAAIEEAIRRANAHAFVAGLPGGLDAQIGPQGRLLSGGQRQRVALARAFVRRPDLLILDEATNAVDNVTEFEIQQAIDALAGECTILVIAHRLGTLRRSDRAVVLEAGRIIEQGTPDELLAAGGLLARQYALN
jgi:subfamily B ATP-binding cassette protein MsbA